LPDNPFFFAWLIQGSNEWQEGSRGCLQNVVVSTNANGDSETHKNKRDQEIEKKTPKSDLFVLMS
jgi:hypothetical protein